MPAAEKKYFKYLLLWLCLGAAFLYASFTLFGKYRFSFHSDGAIKSVLTRLAFDEGRLIPHNWVYANGDLLFVGPQAFSTIIFPWLGLDYLSNAISDWLAYLYLLLMVYGSCRVIAPERRRAAITATVLAAGCLSALNFEFVVGQGAYSMYTGLALGLFCLASRQGKSSSSKGKVVLMILAAAAACLVCISNSTRGGVTVIVPLLVGWFVSRLISFAPTLRDRIRSLGNPGRYRVICGAAAGAMLYLYWLLPNAFNYDAAARVGVASRSDMWLHVTSLPNAWFDYFLVGEAWGSLSPMLRLLQGLAWAIAGALLLAPCWVVCTPRRHGIALVTLSWIVLVSYGVSFGALVVAESLFHGMVDIRYATFAIYGSVCIIAILADCLGDRYPTSASALLLAMSFIAVATMAAWRPVWSPDQQNFGERMTLIRSLKGQGVGTVLATYWHSHVLTVLSSGEVDAYPVGVDSVMHPFPHHLPRKIFYGTAGNKQAVVLSDDETKPSTWATVEGQLGEPAYKFRSGPFEVWVYERDITKLVLGVGFEADTAIPADQLMVRLSRTNFPRCKSAESCKFTVEATNTGKRILATAGAMPLRFGIQGINSAGGVVDQDLGRVDFPLPLDPMRSEQIDLSLPPLSNPKAVGYRICLIQEFAAWHCDRTRDSSN
ncbi:MAG: hypothetical protein ACHP8A_10775 [Terriglobales bacterium]